LGVDWGLVGGWLGVGWGPTHWTVNQQPGNPQEYSNVGKTLGGD